VSRRFTEVVEKQTGKDTLLKKKKYVLIENEKESTRDGTETLYQARPRLILW